MVTLPDPIPAAGRLVYFHLLKIMFVFSIFGFTGNLSLLEQNVFPGDLTGILRTGKDEVGKILHSNRPAFCSCP